MNNIAALEILMDCGYVRAGVLVGIGAAVRSGVAWGMLKMGGLGTGWEGYSVEGEVGRWWGEVRSLV